MSSPRSLNELLVIAPVVIMDSEAKEHLVDNLSDKFRADFLNGLRRDTRSLLSWGAKEHPQFAAVEEDFIASFGDGRSKKTEKTDQKMGRPRPRQMQLCDFVTVPGQRPEPLKARRIGPSSSAKGTSSKEQDVPKDAGSLPRTPLHSTPVQEILTQPTTDPKLLQGLAEIYAGLIKSHKVPSMMEELYFVIQMLTATSPSPGRSKHPPEDMLGAGLGTSCNATFFAVEVLKRISYLFKFLDPATLRLLKENTRVQHLGASGLFEKMQMEGQVELERSLASLKGEPNKTVTSYVANLPGNDESKDHSAHFSSEMACKKFKGQRDELADMLIIWSQNQWQNKWSMPEALGGRIAELFKSPYDPYVLHRFSELFVKTLIMETVVRNIPDAARRLNPSKTQRLQLRQAAYTSKGPSPPPSFSSQEKFFRNFIKIADSYQFCFHLTNVLVEEINKLTNETHAKGKKTKVDTDTMCKTVEILQVLGKFLGLVTFLPYQSVGSISAFAQEAILNARINTQLPVDLEARLREAVRQGHLSLTLPWVIEMLSMADSMAFRLPSLQGTLATLRHVQREALTRLQKETCSRVDLMAVLKIEWLLRIPSIPAELVFQTPPAMDLQFSFAEKSLDTTAEFDTVALYGACPYLHELTLLLQAFVAGRRVAFSSPRSIVQSGLALPLSSKTKDEALVHDLEECLKDKAISDDRRAMRSLVRLLIPKYLSELSAFVHPMFLIAKGELVKAGKNLEENCNLKDIETSLQKTAFLISRSQAKSFTPKVCARFHRVWRTEVQGAVRALIRTENRLFFKSITNVVCLEIERELRQWLQQFEVNLKNRLMSEITLILFKINQKRTEGEEAEEVMEEKEEKPFEIEFSPCDRTRPESLVSGGTAVEESWTCTCQKLSEEEPSEEEPAEEEDAFSDTMPKERAPERIDLTNLLNEVMFQAMTAVDRAREGELTFQDRFLWVNAERALSVVSFQNETNAARKSAVQQLKALLRQLVLLAIARQPILLQQLRPFIDAFHATTVPCCSEFISCAAWDSFLDVEGTALVASMEQYCLLVRGLAATSSTDLASLAITQYTQNQIEPDDKRAYAVVGALIGLLRAKTSNSPQPILRHLGVFFFGSQESSPLKKALRGDSEICRLDKETLIAMEACQGEEDYTQSYGDDCADLVTWKYQALVDSICTSTPNTSSVFPAPLEEPSSPDSPVSSSALVTAADSLSTSTPTTSPVFPAPLEEPSSPDPEEELCSPDLAVSSSDLLTAADSLCTSTPTTSRLFPAPLEEPSSPDSPVSSTDSVTAEDQAEAALPAATENDPLPVLPGTSSRGNKKKQKKERKKRQEAERAQAKKQ